MIDYIFFSIFTIDIAVNFLTEYRDVGETQPIRQFEKIAQRYIQGEFLLDLVAWFPIHYIIDRKDIFRLSWIFLLKLVRFYKAIKLLNVSKIMKFVRKILAQRTQDIINNEPNEGHSND